jgi:poly-gamma-glutamate capsule biosynthesis protein CapA/YwtB (metallophosphatase superfamily)
MVAHPQVLTLARQGDAQSIAYLINQALNIRGIHVRAIRKNACLHVLLEAAEVPDYRTYARVVYAVVLCLGAATIQTLQVYGRQKGDKLPAWTQAFRLSHWDTNGKSTSSTTNIISREQPKTQAKTLEADEEPAFVEFSPLLPEISQAQGELALRPNLVLPVLLSICASFSVGAGLGYFRAIQERNNTVTIKPQPPLAPPQSPIQAPVQSPTLPPQPAGNQPAPPPGQPAPPSAQATPSASASPTPTPTPSPALAPVPANLAQSPVAAKSQVAITINAVGDMIPGSNFPGRALPNQPGEQLDAEREFLFGNIKPFFGDADLLFGNFESTLTDYPDPAKDTSRGMTFAFRTPPVYAQMLKQLGFNVLNIANNHSFDFGDQGFADTFANIEQAGMKAVGKKGQILYMTVNNIPIAFIGFSFLPDHNSMQDLATAGALVREAKKQAKIVVVSVHAGAEGTDETHVSNRTEYFFGEDRGNVVQFAHTVIDNGADLVLGHSPHVPRAVELYQNKLIAYSLGNFIGYRTLSTVGTLGDSLILKVQMDAKGNFVGGRIIPVALDSNGIPKLDDYFQSVVLIRNLTKADFPQTPITIDDMGYIIPTSK